MAEPTARDPRPPTTSGAVLPAGVGFGRQGLRVPFVVATAFFTLSPLVSLLARPPRIEALLLLLGGWAIFVAVLADLFARGRFVAATGGRWLVAAALAMTAIAVVTQIGFVVGEAGALYYYAGVTAGRIRPQRLALAGIGFVALTAGIATAVGAGDWGAGAGTGVTVGTISLTLFALSALGRANRELQEARRELADLAVAEERSRIARDLHDTLGHSLSVIALKAELARRLLPDGADRAEAEIVDVERVAREALVSVRDTVSGYRQPTLAIELAGARAALAAAGIEGDVEPAPEGLPRDVDAMLGWAVREGVTNVLRHSEATTARVRVVAEGGGHAVEVEDDGRGRLNQPVPDDRPVASRPGVGLAGLRERAARLGGTVEAGPLPERGYRLRVTIPAVAVATESGS